LLITALQGGSFGVERVDLLAEDTGTWINYDLPDATTYPTAAALRFVEQIKVVWHTPWTGVSVGTALGSQSVVYEQPLLPEYQLSWSAGVQTALLLPRGALLGLAWRPSRFRIGVGVSFVSSATWVRPDWSVWSILPTFGFGIVFAGDETGQTG